MNQEKSGLIAHIRKLTHAHMAARQNDAQLIGRFVRSHDEAAFQALMSRHGPMVLRVCRRALGHDQDAEDVFQATFLLLSRKAASLRDRGSVGPWLYGVASRLALKARTAARRRAAHEALAPARTTAGTDPSLAETQALLEEELGLLPDKYRSVLVLCYIQGFTRDQAAQQLGLSLAGIKKRLERGRELLHGRLARRGIQLSAVMFGMLLAGEAMAVVPRRLADTAMDYALALVQGKSLSAAGAGTIALYRGGLLSMSSTRLKIAAAATAVAVGMLILSGFHDLAAGPTAAPVRAAAAPVLPPRSPEAKPQKETGRTIPEGFPLEARLVGKKTSFPLQLNGMTPEKFRERLKPGPVLPGQPQVDLQLEVTNTGDKPLKLLVGGSANSLTLDLQGPAAVIVPGFERRLKFPLGKQPGREVTVPAGKTVVILDIPRLIYKNEKGLKLAYWTEAGDYTLIADYVVMVSPPPANVEAGGDGFAPVTLQTPKFQIKVEAPDDKQAPTAPEVK